jgi:hypothetical protein
MRSAVRVFESPAGPRVYLELGDDFAGARKRVYQAVPEQGARGVTWWMVRDEGGAVLMQLTLEQARLVERIQVGGLR